MMRSIICTVVILLITGCSPPGSKLVGKWSVESDSDKFWGSTKNKTKPVVEFTPIEMIRNGFHDQKRWPTKVTMWLFTRQLRVSNLAIPTNLLIKTQLRWH